jgi:drug/metabolite transporter (DMT)-like permease
LGGELRRHRHRPRIVPAASLCALRLGPIAFPAIFFVPRLDVRWLAVVAVGLFICGGQLGLLFVAMNTGLPAELASVIAPLQPVFTIPFAVVALGERSSLRQVAGVSLAIAGLGAIAGRARGVPLQAVALGVPSAASWGCGNVVTRAAGAKRPFSLLVWSSVVAPVPLLGLSLVGQPQARQRSRPDRQQRYRLRRGVVVPSPGHGLGRDLPLFSHGHLRASADGLGMREKQGSVHRQTSRSARSWRG